MALNYAVMYALLLNGILNTLLVKTNSIIKYKVIFHGKVILYVQKKFLGHLLIIFVTKFNLIGRIL